MKKQTTRKPEAKTIAVSALAQVRGGSLNTYITKCQGEKQLK